MVPYSSICGSERHIDYRSTCRKSDIHAIEVSKNRRETNLQLPPVLGYCITVHSPLLKRSRMESFLYMHIRWEWYHESYSSTFNNYQRSAIEISSLHPNASCFSVLKANIRHHTMPVNIQHTSLIDKDILKGDHSTIFPNHKITNNSSVEFNISLCSLLSHWLKNFFFSLFIQTRIF